MGEGVVGEAGQAADDGDDEGRRYDTLDLGLVVVQRILQVAGPQRHAVLHACRRHNIYLPLLAGVRLKTQR